MCAADENSACVSYTSRNGRGGANMTHEQITNFSRHTSTFFEIYVRVRAFDDIWHQAQLLLFFVLALSLKIRLYSP